MNILPEIVNRRSVRKFNGRDVSDEQIVTLLKAAQLAPSGTNKQPWDFIVVRSEEWREKICQVDQYQKWMLTAPAFIVVVGNERYRGDGDMTRVIRDSAIATEHILLQAEHMGLATCWTGWYDQDEMRELLGLDDHCYVTGVIVFGYTDEKPAAAPRREIQYKTL